MQLIRFILRKLQLLKFQVPFISLNPSGPPNLANPKTPPGSKRLHFSGTSRSTFVASEEKHPTTFQLTRGGENEVWVQKKEENPKCSQGMVFLFVLNVLKIGLPGTTNLNHISEPLTVHVCFQVHIYIFRYSVDAHIYIYIYIHIHIHV